MFSDDSAIRLVHRERVLALYGPRALLMQAAHPEAVRGLLSHSSALEAPYERLARTAQVMDVVHFGTRQEAERVTRRVRAMHRRAGVDRPDWLLWILFTLYDSALVVYRSYVGSVDADELWRDYRVVGRLFGLAAREMPRDVDAYRDEIRGFYFDFTAAAPGPLLRTTDEVAEALRGLDDIVSRYGRRYAEFVSTFCELDDGHAAARVVDRVFSS